MDLRTLDVHDDRDCEGAYAVLVAAKGEGRPWNEPPSLTDAVVEWRHEDPTERTELWAAVEAGRVVGVGTLWLSVEDNLTKAWGEVAVDPAHRRRGAGRTLVERLAERAAQEGRVELLGDLNVPPGVPDHPHLQFARATGFEVTNTEIMRRLELPVDDGLLDELWRSASASWEEDYDVQTHVGGVPEPLQESLCAVMALLGVDAPTGDVDYEPETFTPEIYRDHLGVQAEQGRTRLTTIAVHRASGEVAAYTDLMLPAAPNRRVWQWGTYVHRDHRGHRLGTAVKIANLRELQRSHPGRDAVVTGNDETNHWMVDINLALGFEVQELNPHVRRRLDCSDVRWRVGG